MEYVTVAGEEVPALGLGTYRLRGRECRRTVEDALELGYRHVDTAEFYDNHAPVGEAISNAAVAREELFLTTKIWKSNLRYEDVLHSVVDSLETLDLEYVDLLLIHWPNERVPVEETIDAMNDLQAEGIVRHVGVSNFSIHLLRKAIDASETPILTNQVQYNPLTDQRDLLEFCLERDVMLTAYSPLAKGRVLENGTLAEIGESYGKSPAQVALRWLIQQEVVAASPKASSREHLEANLAVFDFELTDDEMTRIFDLQGSLLGRLRARLGL